MLEPENTFSLKRFWVVNVHWQNYNLGKRNYI